MAKRTDEYSLATALGSVFLASELASSEENTSRRDKMDRVVKENIDLIRDAWPKRAESVVDGGRAAAALVDMGLDHETRHTLMIDLVFSDPFAPYELEYNEGALKRCLETLALLLSLPSGIVDEIGEIRKEASRAYSKHGVVTIAAFGVGGAALLALGGYVAAPAIAAYLGASAGLSGAAATLNGLALLGGGTLAAGGSGAAGGMAIITGAGAIAGGASGIGGSLLYQMGAAGSRNELIKLQVTYKAVLLTSQLQTRKAQQVTKGLAERERELSRTIDEQLLLNDENSHKIKELREILEAVEKARAWMIDQKTAA